MIRPSRVIRPTSSPLHEMQRVGSDKLRDKALWIHAEGKLTEAWGVACLGKLLKTLLHYGQGIKTPNLWLDLKLRISDGG